MKKIKKSGKKLKPAIAVLAILLSNIIFWPAKPLIAALAGVEAIISDSRAGISADLTLKFTTSLDIGAGGYFLFVMDEEFGPVSEVVCPGPDAATATTSHSVRCTYSASPGAATSTSLKISKLANPAQPGRYNIQMDTFDSGDNLLESGNAAVFITEAQEIVAFVGAILAFSMEHEEVAYVNGVRVTGSSTPELLDFGLLSHGASTTLAQTLSIRTNAQNGFACTVQQDQELTSETDATINSFNNAFDGTGSSTQPSPWAPPSALNEQDHTFGHLGLTTDDPELSVLDFSGAKYAGLNGAEPLEVYYHSGPTINETIGEGKAHIAYTLEVSALQEHGNYTSGLTYVCTGVY